MDEDADWPANCRETGGARVMRNISGGIFVYDVGIVVEHLFKI